MSITLEVVKELLEAHRSSFQRVIDYLKSEVKGLKKELLDFNILIQFVSNENYTIKSTIKNNFQVTPTPFNRLYKHKDRNTNHKTISIF